MEKLLNRHEECVRKAMLRHEETFRDQVNELHRLYRTQKILMKDLATVQRINNGTLHPRAPEFVELENSVGEYNSTEAGENSRVLEAEDDQSTDLELTLGPRSYCQRKIKAAEPGTDLPGFGPGFSSISCMKRTKEGKQSQERLDNSHWVFQVLSLNMT